MLYGCKRIEMLIKYQDIYGSVFSMHHTKHITSISKLLPIEPLSAFLMSVYIDADDRKIASIDTLRVLKEKQQSLDWEKLARDREELRKRSEAAEAWNRAYQEALSIRKGMSEPWSMGQKVPADELIAQGRLVETLRQLDEDIEHHNTRENNWRAEFASLRRKAAELKEELDGLANNFTKVDVEEDSLKRFWRAQEMGVPEFVEE